MSDFFSDLDVFHSLGDGYPTDRTSPLGTTVMRFPLLNMSFSMLLASIMNSQDMTEIYI